ncbi:Uncharacterised protein [uncultured archaeon]|nr:Uncharacterised protein [uncultured archaeon]
MLSKGQRTYLKQRRREIKTELADSTDLSKSNKLDLEKKRRLENELHKTDYAIKTKVKKALEDLTLIAEKIPEKQKAEMFTKDTMRDFIKAVLKDGDGKSFTYEQMPEAKERSKLPEPIHNKRIFDLGTLLAGFGVNSAYYVISLKHRLKDLKEPPTKGEMWELIDVLDGYGYVFSKEK